MMKKLLGVALLGVVAAGPVGGQHAAFDASASFWDQLRWTNRCSESITPLGAGNNFFSTCNSAQLTLFQNGWVELLFWNRNGIQLTEEDSRVKAVALSGISTPSGTRGTGTTNGWDVLLNGFQLSSWGPETDISGFSSGNGYETNKQTICSDLASNCPGQAVETQWNPLTTFAGGGGVQFVWFVGTGFTDIFNDIALETHAIAGPNGWSTNYVCTSDTGADQVNLYNKLWNCSDTPGGGTGDGDPHVVPEPATMTLLATGLAGLAAARRRRKNNA